MDYTRAYSQFGPRGLVELHSRTGQTLRHGTLLCRLREYALLSLRLQRPCEHKPGERTPLLLRLSQDDGKGHSPGQHPGTQASGHRKDRLPPGRFHRRLPGRGVVPDRTGAHRTRRLHRDGIPRQSLGYSRNGGPANGPGGRSEFPRGSRPQRWGRRSGLCKGPGPDQLQALRRLRRHPGRAV